VLEILSDGWRHVTRPALDANAFKQATKAVGCALVQVQFTWLRFTRYSENRFHAFKLNCEASNAADDRPLSFGHCVLTTEIG
jgi:hypothetical protein